MKTKIPKEVVLGVYQHYKGPHYLVLGVARNANSEERSVVYMPLEPHGNELPMLTYRPIDGEDGFFVPAVVDGKKRERFTLLYPTNSIMVDRQKIKKRKR